MAQAMTARAETELRISDGWLDAHINDDSAYVDCQTRTPIEAFDVQSRLIPPNGAGGNFELRGVSIDNAYGDATASYGFINRCLLNHQPGQQSLRRYACGITHPHSVHFIYPRHTTARGISVYA